VASEVLGWFSYRPATTEQPSAREAAVTAALQSHLTTAAAAAMTGAATKRRQQQPPLLDAGGWARRPVVFLLITSGTQHGGATLHLSYRCHQLPGLQAAADGGGGSSSSGSGSRQPSQGGAGSRLGAGEGGALHATELRVINLGKLLSAAHGCAPFETPALSSTLSCGAWLPAAAERRLREAAAGAAGEAAEALCGALLAELRELSGQVGAGVGGRGG
jgi:hypothetical protein